jgi:tetratricopeptide (TPR) repeat protein
LVWQETWNEERAAAVKAAFLATRAARAEEQLADVVGRIDAYGERWIEIHRDACEATQLRGERSQGLLDLQVACLDRGRRGIETFVDLLTRADDTMVDRSSDAARKFHVEGCADLDDLQRAVRPPEDAETQQVVEEISMRLQEGRLLVELGHPEDARPILDAVVTDSDAVGYRPLQANARLAQLDTDTLAAQSKEGIERMYEALWFAEASGDDETTAESWLGLAGILAHHGRVDEALGAGQRADAVLERMGNPPELRARWHDSLGSIQLEQRHYADAVEHFTAAITIEEERLGDESQALSRYYGNLGNAHALHSAIEPAYRAFERAHELAVRHYGEDHPKIGYSLLNLGRMAARRDDFASSNEIYRKAIVILRAANGADDTLAAMTLNNLGQNYGDMGHYEEAIAAIEEAIPILERKMGREHRALLRPHRGLAEVYLDAGMFDHALAEGRAALEISLGSQGAAHPETGYCRRRLFEIHLARREYQQADVELDQAQKIFEQAGEEIGEVAVTRFFRAQLLWATKHRRQALVLAEQAAGELQAQGADFANKLEDVRTWLQSREG